jgi:hypothetical protein
MDAEANDEGAAEPTAESGDERDAGPHTHAGRVVEVSWR